MCVMSAGVRGYKKTTCACLPASHQETDSDEKLYLMNEISASLIRKSGGCQASLRGRPVKASA